MMRLLRALLLLVVLLLAARGASLSLAPDPDWPAIERDWALEVIAHRGGMLEVPDSTLAAFDHAVAVGSHWLELDVHLSADGHLVVFHDGRLERTTDGEGLIGEATLAELQQLDAAYWWPHDHFDQSGARILASDAEFPWRGRGLHLPTLAEIFERYPGHRLMVDIKSKGEASVVAMLELLERYQRWDRTVLNSFHDDTLRRLVALDDRVIVSAGPAEVRRLVVLQRLGLAHLWRGHGRFMMVPQHHGGRQILTAGFLRAAHGHGLPVYAWTINDEATMHELMDLGVDGLITDRPAFLQQLLTQRMGYDQTAETTLRP